MSKDVRLPSCSSIAKLDFQGSSGVSLGVTLYLEVADLGDTES